MLDTVLYAQYGFLFYCSMAAYAREKLNRNKKNWDKLLVSNLNNSVPFEVAFHSNDYLIWLSDKKKTRCQFNDTYDGEFGDHSVQRAHRLRTFIDNNWHFVKCRCVGACVNTLRTSGIALQKIQKLLKHSRGRIRFRRRG